MRKRRGIAEQHVVGPERRAQRASAVAGCRLNEDVLERRLAQDAMIGHAVQPHATGDAQILQAGFFVQLAGHADQHFFRHLLDAGGDVGVVLVQLAKLVEVRGRFAKVCRESPILR